MIKLFTKAKDGGSKSPVDAYFIVEWKRVFSIALLKFNKGTREEYHTHAYKASWCITIRGPWDKYWTEYNKKEGETTTLTHGRKVVGAQ